MKRCAELRDLSDDHHGVLVLAQRAKRAGAGAAAAEPSVDEVWRQLAAAYERELRPHFEVEEEVLLPALERADERGLAERTRAEHRAIRAALSDERRRDADALATLGRFLESHVRFEERVLFERAQAVLSAAELETVAAARRERGGRA